MGGDVFCGVFDGHGGWQVAEYASTHLSRNLEVELTNMGALSGTEQVGVCLCCSFPCGMGVGAACLSLSTSHTHGMAVIHAPT